MTVRFNAACAAIAVLCLSSTAFAQDAKQISVSTTGLDLATPAGVATLHTRINSEIMAACPVEDISLDKLLAAQACRADLAQAADRRVAALLGQSDTELAYEQVKH